MLRTYIEQIVPCAYTILGIESFIIFSIVFWRPKAFISVVPAFIAYWNISTCAGHRADNGSGDDYVYIKSDGSIAENEWISSEGDWYYVGEGGKLKSGWFLDPTVGK